MRNRTEYLKEYNARPEVKAKRYKCSEGWRKAHRADRAAYMREWYRKPGNAEKRRVYLRARHLSNFKLHLLTNAKMRAKKAGIEFSIDESHIEIVETCPVLGTPLSWGEKPSGGSPSIDRIDNSKGYVPGNVKIISRRANTMKSDGTAAEHDAIAKYMRSHGVY